MNKRIFLITSASIFLIISAVNLFRQQDNLINAYNKLFPTPTPKALEVKGIGVIGDSLSDEYQADDLRGYSYSPTTLNWIEQLVKNRDLNFGLWGKWGDIRRSGFAYNWSRSGATSKTVIKEGQHIGLAKQIAQGDVNLVIVFIGANDFFPFSETYTAIYNGKLNAKELENEIDNTTKNIELIVDTVENAGKVSVLLVTIPDWNMSTSIQLSNQDYQGRMRVTSAISNVNEAMANIAKKKNVAVADANAFYQTILSDAPLGSIRFGNSDISLFIPGDDPHQAFLSDAIHPGTVMNGLFANYIISRINSEFNTDIRQLSTVEIETNAGLFN